MTTYDNDAASPLQREAMRRDAGFIGWSFILLLALLNVVFTLILWLLGAWGVADLSAQDGFYGLGSGGFLFAYAVAYSVAMGAPAPIVAGITHRRIRPFSSLEEDPPPLRFLSLLLALLGGLALCVIANFVASYLMTFFSALGIPQPDQPNYLEPDRLSLLINIVIFALLPAVFEEMVFRGYFLRVLRPYGGRFAVVVSALLFSLMHGNVLQIPFALIVGLALGWLAVRTGRIWPAMLLHFLNNFMAEVMQYVSLGRSSDVSQRMLLIVFSVIAIIGLSSLLALYAMRDPLVAPYRKQSLPSAGDRAEALLTSPPFLIGVLLSVLLTILSVWSSL